MRLDRSALLIIFLATGNAAWAATSCVQSKADAAFTAVNHKGDCIAPEKLIRKAGVNIEPQAIESRTVTTADSPSQWELRAEDGSVYAAIKRWSVGVGWQVSWEIPVDFPIEIVDASTGSFEDSVRRVLSAFSVSDYPPHPCFHQNKVIRVVRRIQGNDDECH